MIEHCLIYCCVSGKSLYKNYLSGKGEFVLAAKRNVLPRARVLNGTVCFECEIEKAEKIVIAPFPFANGDYQYATKTLTPDALEARSCLSVRELNDYDPRHALYLTNVNAVEPFKITELWKDKAHPGDPYHLSRAPQNMCLADWWNGMEWERVLVLSLRPRHLCNIANGLKDIETRRQVVNEIKEMEK